MTVGLMEAMARLLGGGGLTPARLQELLAGGQATVIDVREPSEFKAGHIKGAINIPLGKLRNDPGALPQGRQLVAVCLSGRRSAVAVKLLTAAGHTGAYNLAGGMQAWPYEVEKG